MASKVWDDLSMWNVDFSNVSDMFDLKRVNELELALLDAYEYEVKVSASDYAKYYFHLRSLMARFDFSSLSLLKTKQTTAKTTTTATAVVSNDKVGGGGGTSRGIPPVASYEELKPLDIIGARKLQLATEKYEMDKVLYLEGARRRSTSSAAMPSHLHQHLKHPFQK